MVSFKSSLVLALWAISAVALPSDLAQDLPSTLEDRQAKFATTCGKTSYGSVVVAQAVAEACKLMKAKQTLGTNKYPHAFNNREGLRFSVSGSLQEFPLVSGGPYSGGSPGADRVVINAACSYGGAMTHTGAKQRNGFVKCS